MSVALSSDRPRRLRGGVTGPLLILAGALVTLTFLYYYYGYPTRARSYGRDIVFEQAMFGPAIEQPVAFSHRLHVTDKQIDCYYCHPYPERSLNAGMPTLAKCLGCHNHVIPLHEEIQKLKSYEKNGQGVPWVRVYYKPAHVFFPHYRHLLKDLQCRQCHGEVEQVDRLHQVTFFMGLCITCHREKNAPTDCVACHQ